MDREEFWELIERARENVGKTKDIPAWLINYLADKPVEEIAAFDRHLSEMLGKANDGRLWLAAAVLMGGCSDDCFDYFRGWLVAKGKHIYESVLRSPDGLADLDATDGDHRSARLAEMARVGDDAYCKKLGDETAQLPGPFAPALPLRNSELLKVGDDDDKRLRELFPKLIALRERRRQGNEREKADPLRPD